MTRDDMLRFLRFEAPLTWYASYTWDASERGCKSDGRNKTRIYSVRMTEAQHAAFSRLGGAEWLRQIVQDEIPPDPKQ